MAPAFPVLTKFLKFWRETLDGAVHSVRVGHSGLIRPAELAMVGTEFRLQ